MEAHLSKACWRAGAKLLVGFAVIGAVVGIRIVTATPTGIEAEIAELERFEAEQAAAIASGNAVQNRQKFTRTSRSLIRINMHALRERISNVRDEGRVYKSPLKGGQITHVLLAQTAQH